MVKQRLVRDSVRWVTVAMSREGRAAGWVKNNSIIPVRRTAGRVGPIVMCNTRGEMAGRDMNT
jgi:hypothetical protein